MRKKYPFILPIRPFTEKHPPRDGAGTGRQVGWMHERGPVNAWVRCNDARVTLRSVCQAHGRMSEAVRQSMKHESRIVTSCCRKYLLLLSTRSIAEPHTP